MLQKLLVFAGLRSRLDDMSMTEITELVDAGEITFAEMVRMTLLQERIAALPKDVR